MLEASYAPDSQSSYIVVMYLNCDLSFIAGKHRLELLLCLRGDRLEVLPCLRGDRLEVLPYLREDRLEVLPCLRGDQEFTF